MALVISLIAGCVGTGNIWRFPRVAATNGGGTFIVAWTIMWALVCIPIMLGEHVIGRTTRHGTPGAFRDFIGRNYTWMGTVIAITMAGIAAYYSTVIAWVLQYLGLAVTKGYYGVEDKQALFDSISNGNIITVLLFVFVLGLSAFIVLKGVRGIEKANKIFIPILFGCLLISAINSLMLPGSSAGLHYLFNIDVTRLLTDYKVWLEALTQAVWSAGPGWGLVITLAVFSRAKSDVGLTTITQGFGDNAGALLAALVVLPAIFAIAPSIAAAEGICAGGNNGLTFVSMTTIFENMPGGYLVAILFFVSLFVAAISSNVCHFMICSLPFVDSKMKKRKSSCFNVYRAADLGAALCLEYQIPVQSGLGVWSADGDWLHVLLFCHHQIRDQEDPRKIYQQSVQRNLHRKMVGDLHQICGPSDCHHHVYVVEHSVHRLGSRMVESAGCVQSGHFRGAGRFDHYCVHSL